MKKIFNLIIISTISLLLSSCGNSSDLTITEYVEGFLIGSALEIYNPTNNDIDLSDYMVGIYQNGEELNREVYLSGTLKTKECYVIVSDDSQPELLEKADLVSSELVFNGNDPITLFNNGEAISALGIANGLGNYFGDDVTFVKLEPDKNLCDDTYDEFHYVRYPTDTIEYLGTIEHNITKEELLAGPTLQEEWKDISFFAEGTTSSNVSKSYGTGGAVEVTLKTCGDGDTTQFYYPQEFTDLGLESYDNRVRYYGINTPESGGSTGSHYEAFGKTAANYLNEFLENAESIYIQSISDSTICDTYERLLAFVYIDGVLINHEIIKKGYSQLYNESTMTCNGVEIGAYMRYAYLYAERNGLGIHGETDPLWDYENSCPL